MRIEEVDVSQRRITCKDKTDRIFQIDFPFSGPAWSMPMNGERWTLVREGYSWFLGQRLDDGTGDRVSLDSLQPGDTRVRARGILHLDAKTLKFNQVAFGVQNWQQFTVPAAENDILLAYRPLNIKAIQAFNNGILVPPLNITLQPDGRTLLFAPTLSAGTLVVYYQHSPEL